MSKIARRGVFVATAILLTVFLPEAIARAQVPSPALPEEWAKVRQALEKYQDVIVALRDGYRSAVLCVQDENKAGMGTSGTRESRDRFQTQCARRSFYMSLWGTSSS